MGVLCFFFTEFITLILIVFLLKNRDLLSAGQGLAGFVQFIVHLAWEHLLIFCHLLFSDGCSKIIANIQMPCDLEPSCY